MLAMAYLYQYGMFILCALMAAWGFASLRKRSFTQRTPYKVIPFVFSIAMFAWVLRLTFLPSITIVSPPDHTIIHPGDKVKLKIEMNPAFISNLFPFVSLRVYRCYTCADWPKGVSTEGALTGSPYTFMVNIPPNQPVGEIVVDAYASIKSGDGAAIRSRGIGLMVK